MDLIKKIAEGGLDEELAAVYLPDGVKMASQRLTRLLYKYGDHFGSAENVMLLSAPGRTEIGGNHTDHNHGRVLAGAVNLDMIAAAAPTGDNWVTVFSDGFPEIRLDLSGTGAINSESGTSAALIRGVAQAFKQGGYKIGGFNACVSSDVLKGSGLSSSAAFEVLSGCIMSHLFNGGAVPAERLAVYGQFAENAYFGKPCGLMDQMASAVGGFVAIDFKDPDNPVIEPVDFNLTAARYTLCVVDTKGGHEDLTDEYAAIPAEMKSVANYCGESVLRGVKPEQVIADISDIRQKCGDRALLRALHFFAEDQRAAEEADALRYGDINRFLSLVNSSGRSSALYLQNVIVNGESRSQPVAVGLCVSEMLLKGAGAVRVHGGGFAGTIQAIVPDGLLDEYRTGIEAVFDTGSCLTLKIRKSGAVRLA